MNGNANDTMFAEERKLKIIDLLNQNKKVTVTGAGSIIQCIQCNHSQ